MYLPCTVGLCWETVTVIISLPYMRLKNGGRPYGTPSPKSGGTPLPKVTLIRPPRTPFRTGLYSARDVFFSPRFLRDPSTDRTETLPHDQNLANVINWLQKFGGAPNKFGGQKHAKFLSILDHFRLWSRISPEQGKISKIGKTYELAKFLLRLMKKVRWTLVH